LKPAGKPGDFKKKDKKALNTKVKENKNKSKQNSKKSNPQMKPNNNSTKKAE
jgi:hypothetical protein